MNRKEAIAMVYGESAVKDWDDYDFWMPAEDGKPRADDGEFYFSEEDRWRPCSDGDLCAGRLHRYKKPKPRVRVIPWDGGADATSKIAITLQDIEGIKGLLDLFYGLDASCKDKHLAILNDYIALTQLDQPVGVSSEPKTALSVAGKIWLSEQDPYEPTGIVLVDNLNRETDLSVAIAERFFVKPSSEPKEDSIRVRITVEEI